jgi:hypothetical protein
MTDAITEAVREKLKQRAERGLIKYGVTVDRDDLTELQWMQHAQEELLDGAVYLEKLMQTRRAALRPNDPSSATRPG